MGRVALAGPAALARAGLRGVWVRGELPAGPAVWAANHHSWWDGFAAAAVLRRLKRPAGLLMDGGNLDRFRYLRAVGVVPASAPRRGLEVLREGRVLVVYPEGELRAPGRLGPLAPGAAWLARLAPAPLVPVAVRVAARGHQFAEAYVRFGLPVGGDALADALGGLLHEVDRALAAGDPREAPAGFRLLVRGRRSWDERLGR